MNKPRYIIAGNLIDGTGTGVQKNIFLEIRDTVITAIGPGAELADVNSSFIDDFSHCTIVPALVDCSVFLLRSPALGNDMLLPSGNTSSTKNSPLLEKHIHYCHTHGVLGVAENEADADLTKESFPGTIEIKTADHDFQKIRYSPSIDDETAAPLLTLEELHHILGNRGKKKTVVVANGTRQVAEAVAAGCDALEQGYRMGEENLKQMAANNVVWIHTLLRAKNMLDSVGSEEGIGCRFSTRYVAPGKKVPGAETFWKKMLAGQLDQLRLARKIGVTTATGTGAGSEGILHGEAVVEEMKLFIKAGFPLVEAVRCASTNGADFLKLDNLGALTVGRKATFLITRGTPQQLPRKLSYLEGIYVNGEPSTVYRKNPTRK
jgi:imidazolonepropionase-like amidohydrolase